MLERSPSIGHLPTQDLIAARCSAEAIRSAETTAPATELTNDVLTWEIAAAVLGWVTGHQHALVPAASHTEIIDRILGTDDAQRAAAEHPGYVTALHLAASAAGLTALYGLVYSWRITVRDHTTEETIADNIPFEGTWTDAENVAQELLDEHDIIDGHADIDTCAGTATTITT